MSRSAGANGGKVYPAPQLGATSWTCRPIFVHADVPDIAALVGLPIMAAKAAALIEGLNEAAVEYFRAARRRRTATPSQLEDWSNRLAAASAAFLAALGLDTKGPAPSLPRPTYMALCSREGSSLTERRYTEGFDYMLALHMGAVGALVAHDLASHAATYYAARKISPQKAARRGLSTRQVLILHLARLFESCFAQPAPKFPEAGKSPFLRFAAEACGIIAARMVPPAKPITEPNDGCDYEAAAFLRHKAEESMIADDLKKIHRFIAQPKRPTSEPTEITATGTVARHR
jgi:hypothetical protein